MKKNYPKIGSPLRRSFDAILAAYGPEYLSDIWRKYEMGDINAREVHEEALHCIYLMNDKKKTQYTA